MAVDAASTTAPPLPRSSPPEVPAPPRGSDVLPTRRALLALLATAGATAAAAPLVGSRTGHVAAGPVRLDPSSALHLRVTGITVDEDDDAAALAHADHMAQHDHDAPDALGARVWSSLVTVALVLRNTAAGDVLFSPGQVRLRLADGTGVMPVESERRAGAVPRQAAVRTWVRFLAPRDESGWSVDYVPAGAAEPVPLPLPGVTTHEHEATA